MTAPSEQIVHAPDAEQSDEFGTTVAYSATALAIGAPFDDLPPTAGVDRGAVYVTGTSGLFVDGFERGDPSRWSATVP